TSEVVSDVLSDDNNHNINHDIESEKQKDITLSSGDMLDDVGIPEPDKIDIGNNQFSYERGKRDKRIDG
ncbi:16998_t:CDS:2, partial [Racocetra persica]